MPITPVIPPDTPPPMAPYSPGVRAGNLLYVSGMLSVDAAGRLVGEGDIRAQTRQVLTLIRDVVAAAGGSMRDVAFNQIFLVDMADYAGMNEVYREFFPSHPPARYCVRSDLVKPGFLVEIVATAYLG